MEDSSKATETVGASPDDAPTNRSTLPELCRAYRALESKQTIPEKGLPFVNEPVLVLADPLDAERASLLVDELWGRGCILVMDRELDPESAETSVDGRLPEKALLLAEPSEDDEYRPRNRYWIRFAGQTERDTPSDTPSDEVLCLIPNIVSSGDEDGDLPADEVEDGAEDPEEGDEPSHSGKPPKYLDLFKKALLSALTVLTGIARGGDGHVHHPMDVLRETLRRYGIADDRGMEFVNWLVQHDYLYIVEIGPKIIWVREEAHALVGQRDKIVKPADADVGRVAILDDGETDQTPSQPDKPDRRYLRGKRFSRDLKAAAIVAFIDVADDSGKVFHPIEQLERVLDSFQEDRERAVGLLTRLASDGFVRGVGNTSTQLQSAAFDFAQEWAKATELTLATVLGARDPQPDEEEEPPEAAAERTAPEALDSPTDVVMEEPTPAVVAVFVPSEPAPAPATVDEPAAKVVEEVAVALPPDRPAPAFEEALPPQALAPMEVAVTPPTPLESYLPIVLTPEALEIVKAYLLGYPGQDAGAVISALIVEHLGPKIRLLEAALERSYALLLERRCKTRDHKGKPIVYIPSSILRCNPPYMHEDEADSQLACMAERGWICWVHPARGRDRRPQPYIVLLR